MSLPDTGPISFSQLAAEADLAQSNVDLNNTNIRKIARKFTAGTTISISDLRGKSRFSFKNGDFASGSLVDNGATSTTDGWTVYQSAIRLNGLDNIAGKPTPADNAVPAGPGDNTPPLNFTFTTQFSTDLPPGYAEPKRSLQLASSGYSAGYGVIHGPYAVGNDSINLEVGDKVDFWWRAAGSADAYDIYAYLLNVDTGATINLINDTGAASETTTVWAQEVRTISAGQAGDYKFIFVSGSFDFTGGAFLGASLYITGINVTKWFDL
jgi:hypothetical protein